MLGLPLLPAGRQCPPPLLEAKANPAQCVKNLLQALQATFSSDYKNHLLGSAASGDAGGGTCEPAEAPQLALSTGKLSPALLDALIANASTSASKRHVQVAASTQVNHCLIRRTGEPTANNDRACSKLDAGSTARLTPGWPPRVPAEVPAQNTELSCTQPENSMLNGLLSQLQPAWRMQGSACCVAGTSTCDVAHVSSTGAQQDHAKHSAMALPPSLLHP